MSTSSELHSFSSLAPVLETIIKNGLVSSFSTDEKISVISNWLVKMIKTSLLPDSSCSFTESVLNKQVSMLSLFGKFSYRIDLIAKGIFKVLEAYSVLQERLDRLTDVERKTLLKQLPENCRLKQVFSEQWKLVPKSIDHITTGFESTPLLLKGIHAATGAIVTMRNIDRTYSQAVVSKGLSVAATIGCKARDQVMSLESLSPQTKEMISKGVRGIQGIGQDVQFFWNLCKQSVLKKGTQLVVCALKKVKTEIEKSKVLIEKELDFFTNDFAFLEETLNKIDSTLKNLPPSKMLACAFLSLDQFNHVTTQANENCPKKLLEDEASRQTFQLYYAAANKHLPTPPMNAAFEVLCHPKKGEGKSLRNRYLEELQEGLQRVCQSDRDLKEAEEKAFPLFCITHRLQEHSPQSLEIIKTAFLVKHLNRSHQTVFDSPNTETSLFLAEMVVLYPQHFLGEKEIEVDLLIKQAGILFVKYSLYPTLIQKFTPADFRDFISGMSKLAESDLEDTLSSVLAIGMIESGIDYLNNPQTISTIALKILKGDATPFSQSTVGDGTELDTHQRFETLLKSLETPDYAESLKGISVQKNPRTPEEMDKQIIDEINQKMGNRIKKYHLLIQKMMGGLSHALGQEVAALSKHKDRKMCLLIFAGQLNKTLKDPVLAPDIDLVSQAGQLRVKRLAKSFYPSTASLMHKVPNSITVRVLKRKQDKLRRLTYSKSIGSIENILLLKSLTHRFMDGLKIHSSQTLPVGINESLLFQGIEQALHHYANAQVKAIWGVEVNRSEGREYKKECLEFLNQLPPKELISMINEGCLKSEIIKQKESTLLTLTEEIDVQILQPRKLASLHPFHLDNVEKRLKELEIGGAQKEREELLETKKFLSLHIEMTKLHRSLCLIYRTQIHQVSDLEVIDQQKLAISQTKIKLQQTQATINLHQKKPGYKKSREAAEDREKFEELKNLYILQKSILNFLIKERKEKDQKLKACKEAFLATNLFQELVEARKRLVILLSDQSLLDHDQSLIQAQQETVTALEKRVKSEQETFKQTEAHLCGYTISPSIPRKMEFLNLRLEEANLQNQPHQNQKQLSHLRQSLRTCYRELLNFDFEIRIGFEVKKLHRDLSESSSAIDILLSHFQLEKANLDQKEKNLLQEKERVLNEKQEVIDSAKALRNQNQNVRADIAKLDEEVQIQESIYNKGLKQFDLQQCLEAREKERDEDVQKKGTTTSLLDWALQKFLAQEDSPLMALESEISDIGKEINSLRNAIADEAIRLSTGSYSAALNHLEQYFGTRDLNAIKALYKESVDQEKAQKKQLQNLDETLEDLQGQLIQLGELKNIKENQIEQIVGRQNEILRVMRCVEYMHSLRV